MTMLFILFAWVTDDPTPVGAYFDQDECWKRAVELSTVVQGADCRVFTSPSAVGKFWGLGPETSPRPKPRPEGLK